MVLHRLDGMNEGERYEKLELALLGASGDLDETQMPLVHLD